jgi:formyltetrahydrofolate deformylase
MQVVITAVGPDHRGLADPIVHSVTGLGANIAEIQMYDHDEESVFSMLTRIELEPARFDELRQAMEDVSGRTNLSIRTWSPEIAGRRPRLAICVTYRPEPALALLTAIRDGQVKAEPRIMIGNREACRGLADEFGVPWFNIEKDTDKAGGTRSTGRVHGTQGSAHGALAEPVARKAVARKARRRMERRMMNG